MPAETATLNQSNRTQLRCQHLETLGAAKLRVSRILEVEIEVFDASPEHLAVVELAPVAEHVRVRVGRQ